MSLEADIELVQDQDSSQSIESSKFPHVRLDTAKANASLIGSTYIEYIRDPWNVRDATKISQLNQGSMNIRELHRHVNLRIDQLPKS